VGLPPAPRNPLLLQCQGLQGRVFGESCCSNNPASSQKICPPQFFKDLWSGPMWVALMGKDRLLSSTKTTRRRFEGFLEKGLYWENCSKTEATRTCEPSNCKSVFPPFPSPCHEVQVHAWASRKQIVWGQVEIAGKENILSNSHPCAISTRQHLCFLL